MTFSRSISIGALIELNRIQAEIRHEANSTIRGRTPKDCLRMANVVFGVCTSRAGNDLLRCERMLLQRCTWAMYVDYECYNVASPFAWSVSVKSPPASGDVMTWSIASIRAGRVGSRPAVT